MSDPVEAKQPGQKRRSKKIKKSYNLFDFVVVKQKNKQTKQITRVKVSKQIQKRGKVRKKKLTTIKKRILKERAAKRSTNEETTASLAEKVAQIQLNQDELAGDTERSIAVESKPTMLERVALVSTDPASTTSNDLELSFSSLAITTKPNPCGLVQHSRNFREYCNHFITKEMKTLTELTLKDLFKFQENKFQQNPVKAKANKRYVVGFKEVKKFLVVKRLKLVIIAPDLERNSEIEKLVDEVKSLADQHSTPYVFSIKRRHIGYLLLKKVPVSLVGIFDYQGTNDNVSQLLRLLQQEKINYNKAKATIVS